MRKIRVNKSILSPDDKSLLFRMYAEGHSITDIIKYFEDNKIIHPTYGAMLSMCKAKCNQAQIESFREDYYSRIKDVPIAHKRTRLETIQEIMDSLKKTFKKMLSQDGEIKTKQFKKAVDMVKQLDSMLCRAQDEMERKPQTIVALTQNFGNKELSMEELLIEERNIIGRIGELKREGISLPDRAALDNKEDKRGED